MKKYLLLFALSFLFAATGLCAQNGPSQSGTNYDDSPFISANGNHILVAAPVAGFTVSDTAVCEGGSVTFTDTTTNSPTTWSWNFPGGTPSSSSSQNPVVTYSTAGTFTATLIASNASGTDTQTISIDVHSFPAADAGSNISICEGSSTTLSASGGSSYSWFPSTGLNDTTISNPVANPTTTTVYSAIVTNNGCSDTATITVTVNSLPTASAGTNVSICEGSSTTLSASGGSSYSWFPSTGLNDSTISNPVATPNATTVYSVIVTNNGCSDTATITVTVNSLPTVSAGPDVAICTGSGTNLSASGGVSYSWSPSTGLSSTTVSDPVASPSTTTTYTVTATDNNGCSSTDDVMVSVGTNLVASTGGNIAICEGESETISASGGTTYSWSPATGLNDPSISNPVASPNVTTTYTVIVSDNSCSDTVSVTVTVNSLPSASAGTDVSICDGSSTTLSASGGTSFSWSPSAGLNNTAISNPLATPSGTTDYIVTVTDNNNCTDKDTVTVTVNPLPNASAGSDISICEGNSGNLSATGGTGYSWTPSTGLTNTTIPNPDANPAVTTSYYVTVTDGNGCSAIDSVVVTVKTNPVATTSGNTSICDGGSANLTASGGTTFSWSPAAGLDDAGSSAPVASPDTTTTYTVTVTDNDGCSDSETLTVTVNPNPVASTGGNVSTCAGTGIQISAGGGSSYSWSPSTGISNSSISNPMASPSSSTTYTVTVSNSFGCTDTESLTVTVLPSPNANAGSNITMCFGSTVNLNASGGVSYSWSPASGLSATNIANPNASPFVTTNYIVTVTVSNGCTDKDTIKITVNPLPNVPSITQSGSVLNSSASSGNQWYLNGSMISGATGTSFTPLTNGTYSVVVTNSFGCTATSSNYTMNNVAVHENISEVTIKIYPNPNNGEFILQTSSTGETQVIITDATGKMVLKEIMNNENTRSFRIENKGFYMVTIISKDNISTKRLMIR